MVGKLGLRDAGRQRRRALAPWRLHRLGVCAAARRAGEIKGALTPAAQLKISHREKLGVEKRTVQDTVLDRDVETLADRIKGRRRARPMFARQHQRIDEALFRQRRPAQKFKLVVQEAAVEFSVVSDDRIIAEECHQLVDDIGMLETLLVAQRVVGDARNAHRRFGHGPAGIDVDLEFAAGGQIVVQLDTADFYDAVARSWIEAGGFGVEDDFPHVSSCSVAALIRVRSASMISSICASA